MEHNWKEWSINLDFDWLDVEVWMANDILQDVCVALTGTSIHWALSSAALKEFRDAALAADAAIDEP
jgi:hypothetical protein